jgi:formyltetrahydrofolate synthetase
LVRAGCSNLIRHIKNANKFGVPVVVSLNKFSKDTPAEIDLVIKMCKENGAFDAVIGENWEKGGEGAKKLGEAVEKASNQKAEFKFLYDLNIPIDEKIRTIAQKIYHAKDIELSELALKRIDLLKKQVKF